MLTEIITGLSYHVYNLSKNEEAKIFNFLGENGKNVAIYLYYTIIANYLVKYLMLIIWGIFTLNNENEHFLRGGNAFGANNRAASNSL